MNKPNLYLDLDETLIYSIDIRYRKKLPFFIDKFKYSQYTISSLLDDIIDDIEVDEYVRTKKIL